MPIERIPVVHRFGILSRTHQDQIKQQIFEKEVNQRHYGRNKSGPNSTPNLSPINSHDNLLEEIVYQLQHETDELVMLQHEKKAKGILKKIQFKLKDKRNIIETLKYCWKDLSSFISCKNLKIVEESLQLLNLSLTLAPLSKQIIKSLLGIGLCLLQELVTINESDDIVTKRYSNNQLLVETSFILYTRLYYHFMASDLSKIDGISHQLEGLYLINKGLNDIDIKYENNPIFHMHLLCIKFVIAMISKSPEKNEEVASNEILKTNNGPISTGHKKIESSENNRISTLLWNVLCLWKSLSRQCQLSTFVLEDIKSFDFEQIQPSHPLWMEVVLSLHILSECAKLDMKYLVLLTQISPSTKKSGSAWSLSLQYVYLKCLSDVGMHGVTIDVMMYALLGNRNHVGLASFLTRKEKEDYWKIQHLTYQLLHKIYVSIKDDHFKESVCNALWDVLEKFIEKEKSIQVLTIDKLHKELRLNDQNNVFTKVATNFSIIYLPLQAEKRRKDPKKESLNIRTPRKDTEKECGKKFSKISHRVDERLVQTQKIPSSEETSWSDITSIVGQHFSEEVNESEKEVKTIRKNLQELGLVEETLELPVSVTLPDVEYI